MGITWPTSLPAGYVMWSLCYQNISGSFLLAKHLMDELCEDWKSITDAEIRSGMAEQAYHNLTLKLRDKPDPRQGWKDKVV